MKRLVLSLDREQLVQPPLWIDLETKVDIFQDIEQRGKMLKTLRNLNKQENISLIWHQTFRKSICVNDRKYFNLIKYPQDVNLRINIRLNEMSKTFAQPQLRPPRRADQITEPLMRNCAYY